VILEDRKTGGPEHTNRESETNITPENQINGNTQTELLRNSELKQSEDTCEDHRTRGGEL